MIYNKIQDLCEARGISITRLEKDLSFGNGSIHKWSKSYPSADRLKKVCDYFKISLDEIMGGEAVSTDAWYLAVTYDALPKEKQDLIKCYISLIQSK